MHEGKGDAVGLFFLNLQGRCKSTGELASSEQPRVQTGDLDADHSSRQQTLAMDSGSSDPGKNKLLVFSRRQTAPAVKSLSDGDVTVHPVVGEGFRNSATGPPPPMISFDLLCYSIFHSPLHSQSVTTLLTFNWTPGAGFLAVGG